MIELSFHPDLYDAAAVAEAVEIYADFARFEVVPAGADATGPIRVRIAANADGDADEEDVRAEFANYVLGRTIERRPSDSGQVAS